MQELSAGGTPTANLLTGLGVDEVFTRTGDAGANTLLVDALGSTLELANASGTLQQMNKHRSRVSTISWVCFAIIISAGCSLGPAHDVSSERPYADVVGARYRVIADTLYAYGVYRSLSDRTISYVEFVPSALLEGSEFAFKKPVHRGTIIAVLSAWRQSSLLDDRIYLCGSSGRSEPCGWSSASSETLPWESNGRSRAESCDL